mmetsp:Transcript_47734/g.153652  ORF Transcript_47734/g.153652 Transcript_47734/m.153652 type:complete len:432 (-) Transcript_47734:2357-3652(-)
MAPFAVFGIGALHARCPAPSLPQQWVRCPPAIGRMSTPERLPRGDRSVESPARLPIPIHREAILDSDLRIGRGQFPCAPKSLGARLASARGPTAAARSEAAVALALGAGKLVACNPQSREVAVDRIAAARLGGETFGEDGVVEGHGVPRAIFGQRIRACAVRVRQALPARSILVGLVVAGVAHALRGALVPGARTGLAPTALYEGAVVVELAWARRASVRGVRVEGDGDAVAGGARRDNPGHTSMPSLPLPDRRGEEDVPIGRGCDGCDVRQQGVARPLPRSVGFRTGPTSGEEGVAVVAVQRDAQHGVSKAGRAGDDEEKRLWDHRRSDVSHTFQRQAARRVEGVSLPTRGSERQLEEVYAPASHNEAVGPTWHPFDMQCVGALALREAFDRVNLVVPLVHKADTRWISIHASAALDHEKAALVFVDGNI